MNFNQRPSPLQVVIGAIVYAATFVGEVCVRALEGIGWLGNRIGSIVARAEEPVAEILVPWRRFAWLNRFSPQRVIGTIVYAATFVGEVCVRALEGIGWLGNRIGSIVAHFGEPVGQYLVPWRLFAWFSRSLDRFTSWGWWVTGGLLTRLGAVLNRIIPPAVRRWLSHIWVPFWLAGAAAVDFLQAWFASRDYWRLLGAIPAFLLLLPLVLCLVKAQLSSHRAKVHHYRQAALTALEAEDFATANLCYRKLAQLDQSERAEFEAALAIAAEGDLDAAYVAVGRLAPLDVSGYPPAHFWIARQLIQGRLDVPAGQRWQLATQHLQHVLDRNPRDLSAQSLEASLLISWKKNDQAISKLEKLVHQVPAFRLPLADLYLQQGRPEDAAAEARRLLRFYDQVRDVDEALQPHEYLTWAKTARALGNLELAKQVIDKGLAIYPDDQQLAAFTREIELASFDRSSRQQHELAARIAHLNRAFQMAPADDDVLERVAGLARELGVADERFQAMVRPVVQDGVVQDGVVQDGVVQDGVVQDGVVQDGGRAAMDEVQASDREPRSPGSEDPAPTPPRSANFKLHSLLGNLAHAQQEHELALEYFERLCDENPEDPIAANNLAYELQFCQPADLERSLQLANQAVRADPHNPSFRETRGQALVRLQRWEEAVGDLEIAVNAKPGRPDIHGALATAYAALGKEKLAELHRWQAK